MEASTSSKLNEVKWNEVCLILILFFPFSMYFKNTTNQLFTQDKKPTPLPRNPAVISAPTVNTLNQSCYEVINDDFYHSATKLNVDSSTVNTFIDVDEDEDEEMENVDYSNDPRERLIL